MIHFTRKLIARHGYEITQQTTRRACASTIHTLFSRRTWFIYTYQMIVYWMGIYEPLVEPCKMRLETQNTSSMELKVKDWSDSASSCTVSLLSVVVSLLDLKEITR
ncbi:uncharacterized protein LOC117153752 [Bombus vancouverensis nearcticus]|uniref:Uncharacterized protein LOC117211757 n=1 Tax=Bombus bifarius TaxID=103933 RepID=A0A6P8MSV9_9HYME|nr:uncharacterized protein LOC117153752 [Bombus vancouverensis nearcticus]XP_033183989.1 uncharacterized protein LOC117153752 [Bombus vancouverensis nearcticus]XP_033311864.1 uncharacterized protein LOC117211757 [Bombus bifarius]XP_033311866.1 uncharacterized protein LOC117211757 [Bombus bifarius]